MSEPTIEDYYNEDRVFAPSPEFAAAANAGDRSLYDEANTDLAAFWARQAREFVTWFRDFDTPLEWNLPDAKWFVGGQLTASVKRVDRHVHTARRNKAAIIWEGEPGDRRTLTYYDLYREVSQFANVLKKLGVRKGDRVALYLPLIPELAIAMLACARIGAVHSVVFGGFSAESLRDRINDAQARVLVTADGGYRRGQTVPLKQMADEALEGTPSIESVVIVQRGEQAMKMVHVKEGRDHWYHRLMQDASTKCEPEPMDAEDMLYILYTSGTTGKPKGVVHVHGGYMVGTYITTKYVFDLKEDDVYFCVADPGWVTGHSYIVYGPLLNGATILMAEGKPDYPNPGRWWDLISRYGVSIFYTTPTAVRLLMKYGEDWPKKYDLSTLRILGSVGEPINPEAWEWFYRVTGSDKPIMDTWWQTETGAILVTPLPSVPLKPGSATRPFLGIEADVVDKEGNSLPANAGGFAVIKKPWPAMMRTIYKDPDRYKVYWNTIPNCYTAGDVCRKDQDGYMWFMGRADDVIKVAGNRIGTAEVESALVSHEAVAEAAVIGKPHRTAGEAIKAFVILKQGYQDSKELVQLLKSRRQNDNFAPVPMMGQLRGLGSLVCVRRV